MYDLLSVVVVLLDEIDYVLSLHRIKAFLLLFWVIFLENVGNKQPPKKTKTQKTKKKKRKRIKEKSER